MFTATTPLINHLRHGAAMAPCPTRRMRWPHWGGDGCLSPRCPFEPHPPIRGTAGWWVAPPASVNDLQVWALQGRVWKGRTLLSPLAQTSPPYKSGASLSSTALT